VFYAKSQGFVRDRIRAVIGSSYITKDRVLTEIGEYKTTIPLEYGPTTRVGPNGSSRLNSRTSLKPIMRQVPTKSWDVWASAGSGTIDSAMAAELAT
jgi:hypothetical protein